MTKRRHQLFTFLPIIGFQCQLFTANSTIRFSLMTHSLYSVTPFTRSLCSPRFSPPSSPSLLLQRSEEKDKTSTITLSCFTIHFTSRSSTSNYRSSPTDFGCDFSSALQNTSARIHQKQTHPFTVIY